MALLDIFFPGLSKKRKEQKAKKAAAKHTRQIEQLNKTGKLRLDVDIKGNDVNFIVDLERDPFSKEMIIRFPFNRLVNWGKEEHVFIELSLRFEKHNHYLCLRSYQKELNTYTGDELLILFQNGAVQPLTIDHPGKRVDKDDEGVLLETMIRLKREVVEQLHNPGFAGVRYIGKKDGREITTTLHSRGNTLMQMSDIYIDHYDRFLKE